MNLAFPSTTIDTGALIAAQQPDEDDNVIPLGTPEGSAVLSSAAGMTEWMTLVASVGILNVQTATCGTECTTCCGYTAFVNPTAATIPVNGTKTFVATLTSCSGTPKLVAWSWTSNDTSVATVVGGVVTGRGVGSTGIIAKSLEQVVIATGRICNQSGTCPLGYPQNGANVTVYDFTVTVLPSTIRPKDTGGTNETTTVTVQTNPFVSQPVSLQDVRITGSGGHPTNHPTTLPSGTGGTFSAASGSTSSSDGKFTSTYTARIFGGEHQIRATMGSVTKNGPITLRAKVENLAHLTASSSDNFYNSNSPAGQIAHPDNWWGTSTALNGLIATAIACGADNNCNGSKLPYNDISLLWGGKFDGNAHDWTGGHAEHRLGTNCDVNVCDWSQTRKDSLNQHFLGNGAQNPILNECADPSKHTWHVRW